MTADSVVAPLVGSVAGFVVFMAVVLLGFALLHMIGKSE